ncbi:MAG: LamG-like jellyroll fold domain-containing protein [Verrucomicrobiota bacterium]
MSESSSPSSLSTGDRERLNALLEGTLSEEEFESLEHDLREQPELRRQWIRLRDLEAELETRFSKPDAVPSKRGTSHVHWLSLAAAIAIALLAVSLLTRERPLRSAYAAVDLPGLEDVAIVTSMKDVEWNSETELAPGSRLKPGSLHLASGEMELAFLCGATVHLEGPAAFQLLSREQAFLTQGKAAAQVPEEAIGFTIKTPDAAVVDLGTEFALAVDGGGESLVHVYDGEVRVSLLGQDGATLSSAPIYGGGSLEVSPQSGTLQTAGGTPSPTSLPRVERLDMSELNASEAYQNLIATASPLIYWNFNENQSSNQVGRKFHGQLFGKAEIANGALSFDGSGYLTASDLLPPINDQYSISLWAKPSRIHYATVAALCTDGPRPGQKRPRHLNVIELMHQSHLIHRANSVRFLHRWEHGEVNAFSDEPFLPGKWLHIAAVKCDKQVELYINGKLDRVVPKDVESDETSYRLTLGRIDHLRPDRQFHGLMDEVALFPHAISPEQIQEQFQAMAKANPGQCAPYTP